MKTVQNTIKTATVLCLFLVSMTSFAQMALDKVDANMAIITFEAETMDYGTIEQNSNGKRTFTFTNTGSAPLIISSAKSELRLHGAKLF